MTADTAVGCAEHVLNTMVFVSLHFFQLFSKLDAVQLSFGCLFGSFLETLGSLFLICERLGGMVEIRSFYKRPTVLCV